MRGPPPGPVTENGSTANRRAGATAWPSGESDTPSILWVVDTAEADRKGILGFRPRDRLFDAYLVANNALLRVPIHRFREWAFRIVGRNTLGRGAVLERGVRLTTKGGVAIGSRTIVNRNVTLDGRGSLLVGENVNISPEAMLLTAEHDPHSPTFAGRVKATVVGDRVWIASRAVVLPGTNVGEGVVLAAGAVVHGVVEPWTIVAGNPGKVIGQRSRAAQSELPPSYRRLLH
jgi:acetyltransferase-like isoleucine patch superfamily enzyme